MFVPERDAVLPVPLSSAVRTDLRSSNGKRKMALLGAVGWLIYEWGAGNETVTPWMLARVIGSVDGVGVVPATALVGFTFTTVQQLASGFTALYGFSLFELTSRAAWARLTSRRDKPPVSWHSLSLPAKGLLVFGFGSTAVALLQIMTTGRVGVRTHADADHPERAHLRRHRRFDRRIGGDGRVARAPVALDEGDDRLDHPRARQPAVLDRPAAARRDLRMDHEAATQPRRKLRRTSQALWPRWSAAAFQNDSSTGAPSGPPSSTCVSTTAMLPSAGTAYADVPVPPTHP